MLFSLADLVSSLDGGATDPGVAATIARMQGEQAPAVPSNGRPHGASVHAPTSSDASHGLADVTAAAVTATGDVIALLERVFRLAYQCGVRAARSPDGSIDRRSSLRAITRVFDLLVEGVLLVDGAGHTAYVNAALVDALREDAERDHVLRRMRQFGRSLPRSPSADASEPATSCEVETAADRYRLRATPLEEEISGLNRATVVTLERLTVRLPGVKSIMQKFGLTTSEASVARLLSQGYSNSRVAAKIGISPHTAHHHTENVLLKLGVHSRAEVAVKILGTLRSSAPVRVV